MWETAAIYMVSQFYTRSSILPRFFYDAHTAKNHNKR